MSLKSFCCKALLFVLIPVPFAIYLDYIITKGLQISHNRLLYAWSDIRNSNLKSKLWIMGSSRAFHQIATPIIDSVLHTSSYNLGMDGYSFSMENCRFKMALKYNPKPQVIIQVLDLHMLDDREDLYDYQQFLPYLNDSIVLNTITQYKGSPNWLSIYVPLYKFNSEGFLILEGINNYFRQRPTVDAKLIKNYSPNDVSWDGTFDTYKASHRQGVVQKINPIAQAGFVVYLKYCQANNIKLILVYPPEYWEAQSLTQNRAQILNLYRKYALEFNIKFIDYSDNYISKDKKYYYNSQHFNKKGAELFTNELGKELVSELKNITLKSLSEPL